MVDLTLEQIAELEALEALATPGEWRDPQGMGGIVADHPRAASTTDAHGVIDHDCVRAYGGHLVAESVGPENRDLVIALRNAAPALLSMAKRTAEAEAETERWRKAISACGAYRTDSIVAYFRKLRRDAGASPDPDPEDFDFANCEKCGEFRGHGHVCATTEADHG